LSAAGLEPPRNLESDLSDGLYQSVIVVRLSSCERVAAAEIPSPFPPHCPPGKRLPVGDFSPRQRAVYAMQPPASVRENSAMIRRLTIPR